ncbi:MAG: hypothetical protein JXX28_11635 [Deltaproteobacteria bacterium]|nr:hypothetical protein [Deltaproteobacteria bacterium]
MRYVPLLALSLLVSGEALAAGTMRLCVHHSLNNFVDVEGAGDDLVNDSTETLPAYGIKVKVTSPTGSVLFDDYVHDDDACTPYLAVTRGQPHQVTVYGDAEVKDNRIKVWGGSTNLTASQLDAYPWYSLLYPVYSQTYSWTPPTLTWITSGRLTTTGEYAWNISAIAGHALRRDSGGITGQTFRLLNNTTTCAGSAYSQRGRLTICGNHAEKKYIIAHELGHALQAFGRGETEALVIPSAHDYSMPLVNDACTSGMWGDEGGHRFNSREYQSAALHEGFAHFYSALAFNYDDEQDCSFKPYRWVDWNQDGYFSYIADTCCDGVPDGNACGSWSYSQQCYVPSWPLNSVDRTGPASCEGAPAYYPVDPPPGSDHLTWCSDKSWTSWTGPVAPSGTPYDWMRFFWDVHTNPGGASLETILRVYGLSGADDWISSTPDAGHTDADYPAARLMSCVLRQRDECEEEDDFADSSAVWFAMIGFNGVNTDPSTGGY